MRQEVTVLAQLNHPNIVALLGVSFHPMCMVIELAPMGSLFGILDKKIEQYKAAQADRASVILRMPGGVLGHAMSTGIALQVRMHRNSTCLPQAGCAVHAKQAQLSFQLKYTITECGI